MLSPERISVGVPDWERASALGSALGVSPILAQLLLNRGVEDPTAAQVYLGAGLEVCHDPFRMRDMEIAVELIEGSIQRREPIFVHGDYDVDGVSATVLLAEGLRRLGAQVLYHVPHRATEGYGVSLGAVERAASSGAGLLLTADCGSSSREAVDRAHELGLKVIVSDHHRLPEALPQPEAFLNPNLPDCSYPDKGLCGTGIAWKILAALHARRGLPVPLEGLDLVALATIADVAPLEAENRVLVRLGLEALGRLERPGLRALARQCRMKPGPCGAWSVAFMLAPRLNAAGRIDSADLAVELLLEQDPQRCDLRAAELETLNTERQRIEKEIREEIGQRLDAEPDRLEAAVLLEADADWHHGVLGITAARLVDQYARPAFVAALEGDLARGSARAPEGVDLFEAMSRCADLFVKFGGHARAAGFTVEASRLEELRLRLSEAVRELRQAAPPRPVDFELSLDRVTLPLIQELRRLEPVGEGNRKPLFLATRVCFEKVRAVGREGAHLAAVACQGEVRMKGIAFRHGQYMDELASGDLSYDVLFTVEEDTWNGESRPQMVIEAVLAPDPAVLAVLQAVPEGPWAPATGPTLVDSRSVLNRRRYLDGVLSRSGSVLLVAASAAQARQVQERLQDQRVLVAPPEALPQGSNPEEVILLAPPPRMDLFRHPALHSARRIHLLFGDHELSRLEARVGALALDRERMTRIWKALARRARDGGLAETEFERVARDLGGDTHPRTVREAVAVLEELGVASWEEDGGQRRLRLGAGSGRRLEESSRFTELSHLRLEFQRVRRAFGQRLVALEGQLTGA